MIKIKIADITVEIDNKFEQIKTLCRDYLTEQTPQFSVTATEEQIKKEREESEFDCSDGYCETIVAYRNIAERIPEYDAFLFHGSVIEYEGGAYIITAKSGVGKTTHTRLWLGEFKDKVSIINGDKPIVRIIDGIPYAYGTPWQGKENYGRNTVKPVKGILFISRGEKNIAKRITPDKALIQFMQQIYLPKKDKLLLHKSLSLADKMLSSVRLVEMQCNMDAEAAHVAKAALTEQSCDGEDK